MEQVINAERIEQVISVFGSFDENIKKIEEAFQVRVVNRGTELKVSGDDEPVLQAARAIELLLELASKGEDIDEQKVRYLIEQVRNGTADQVRQMSKDVICITAKGKPIRAKTLGQENYVKAIFHNTITVGVGPAGTGKTYLAVAAAVAAFRAKEVNRIILTRPAVEASKSALWAHRGRSPSRRANAWAFCPAICRTRSTLTCARCMTPCLTCWARRPTSNISSGAILRSRPWPTCAAARWTTALSSSTRPRIRPGSR